MFPRLGLILWMCALLPLTGCERSDALAFKRGEPQVLSYKEFLKVRDKPDTVVLDANRMEPLFWVGTEEDAKAGKGLSQKELDAVLSEIIPSKETRVILYCHENFFPTRRVPAKNAVAMSLRGNGYTRVYELDTFWTSPEGERMTVEQAQENVFPYAKPLPASAPALLKRLRPE